MVNLARATTRGPTAVYRYLPNASQDGAALTNEPKYHSATTDVQIHGKCPSTSPYVLMPLAMVVR